MEALNTLIENIANLFKIKSLITIGMSIGMLLLLSGKWCPSDTIITLFSTSYGAIITYFFTKKDTEVVEYED